MIASLILLTHFLGLITLESAYTTLFIAGIVLIIAEIGIVSFGLLAINGLLALYASYTLYAQEAALEFSAEWPLFFGVVFTETLLIITFIIVMTRLRRIKNTTGTESMIGQKATVINWDGKKGSVRYEGEIWKAKSETEMDFNENDEATILSINKLDLTITA